MAELDYYADLERSPETGDDLPSDPGVCWCCQKRPNPKCKCDLCRPMSGNWEQYCRTHKRWERG